MKLYTKSYTMKLENIPSGNNKYQRIKAFTLRNGLRVFYEYVPDTPLVSIQAWVNTGSADEPPELAGITHLAEHMFFKGTSNKHIAAIAGEIESLGGYVNAFTSMEETVFYITIRNDFFDRALEVFAQTIINPSFDEKELKMEKKVVFDEIKRGNDDPYHTLFVNLYGIAYKNHPYGRPITGYKHTLKSFTGNSLLTYYKQWYTPANINLVIVGGVPYQHVVQKIYNAFGAVKSSGTIEHIRPKSPLQKGQRSLIKRLDVKDTYYAMGFLTPPVSHNDSFALELLSYIFGGNETSRLPRIVKNEKGLVNSIMVYHSANKYTGFFSISGTAEPEKLKKALNCIMNTISDAGNRLPTQEEIKRAKQILKSMFIYDLETVKQRAAKIGEAVVEMGGLDFIMDYTKKIDNVTVADMEKVIDKYLTPDRLNIVTILPKKKAFNKRYINIIHPTVAALDYRLTSAGDITTASFENGLRIIVKEKHTIPIVALSAVFFGDAAEEHRDRAGIINLMSMMLKKGTSYRKESDIERESDGVSGMFSHVRTKQSFGITGEFISNYIDDGLNLFSDMLLNSAFEKEEVQRAKKEIISGIRTDRDNIGLQARDAFTRFIYGGTGLSFSEKGEQNTIKRITRRDLLNMYDKLVCSRNGVVAVVGDVDKTAIIKRIAKYLSLIKTGKKYAPTAWDVSPPAHITKTEKYKMKKNQAHIITGTLTVSVNHKDRFAIFLLDQILGGQSGRLFLELRDKRGICYAVQTTGESKLNNRGWFGIYTATSPDKVELSLKVIRSEIERLYDKGINDMELEAGKRYILSDYDNRKQTALNIANMLAYNKLFGRDAGYYNRFPEFIKNVTGTDINTVIKKYFSPDSFITLVLTPDRNVRGR